jgi:glucose-1-phosphate cytidylyltransferase
MKVAILAGGLGTRLSEETIVKAKPMVEIGGYPILWHIMKIYASYGFNEFVIALGYKAETVKDFFTSYHYHASSLTVNLNSGITTVRKNNCENWIVHLLDTGIETQTGGRVKQVADFIGDEPFMLTYGDGVSDVNIKELVSFHQKHGKIATVTAVRPPARFGGIVFDGDRVSNFAEKSQVNEGWINGGFFVLEPQVANYIDSYQTIWERDPLEKLVADEQLMAYRHDQFWQCMDTARDVRNLEILWSNDKAPWKVWA